jgi:lipid-binding SYLF domain-containing protein
MTNLRSKLCLIAVLLLVPVASYGGPAKRAAERAQIDATAQEALARLFEEQPKAKRLYDRAVAYAVFSNIKVSLFVTGGGGRGVAVDKSGSRTYMKMATGGLNLGLGGQSYKVVFLFEDRPTFERFVNEGWEGGASANAVAGPEGANIETSFRNGVAVYQMTNGGLMLQADISGTKYWRSEKLNRR